MPDNLAFRQNIEKLAETNLALACERARELVAMYPSDVQAARILREMVERYARTAPPPRPPRQIPPAIPKAHQLIADGKVEEAEVLLRNHLKNNRHDPPAMHLMAEIAANFDFREDAERILAHAARIHANSADAWAGLGITFHRIACSKDYGEFIQEAIAALDEAIKLEPGHEDALGYKAAVLVQIRALDQAREAYELLLRTNPFLFYWIHYAHLLKTVGEFGASVAAYRTAVAIDSKSGPGWWGIANLKVARFFPEDIHLMEEALEDPDLADQRRVEINFALAKAYDQLKDYEQAARCLHAANRLRNRLHPPEPDMGKDHAPFVRSVFTPELVKAREGWGDPSPDPIFILGMPRAGSTLIEQILASHPLIEGTEELFVLLQISGELATAHRYEQPQQIVSAMDADELQRVGRRYIELTRRYRVTDRPFFTDKNPANWQYAGLIHSMLPNAKIIDVRRNPMDCCFANYFQHFEAGAHFTYSLTELGRYYSDYVNTMRHFERVLPGRIHRVLHDDLVGNFEHEVRRLLDYVGVPFDETCLRFYETERAVHTPSSEQVRQPINRSGFDRWRNYEPWLGELKQSLGAMMEDWRR
jgi:tetratricopeptide (TPR) repeat protein